MKTVVVEGKIGVSVGETINYPPYGRVRIIKVNLPDNMMEVEILEAG